MRTATIRTLEFNEALKHVRANAVFVDLRDVDTYLDVHIPGSLELLYEFGPGMAARARDCIPLEVPLILLDLGVGDLPHAAASLKGKGFEVLGKVDDGINRWASARGNLASTEILEQTTGISVLDVGDPGVTVEGADLTIPIEKLWMRAREVIGRGRVVVAAGYGVRAALAVGILERIGVEVAFWRALTERRPI